MLDHAFTALGLRRLLRRRAADNLADAAAQRQAGFRGFGRRREELWMGGRCPDTFYIEFECPAREFASPVSGAVFVHGTSR